MFRSWVPLIFNKACLDLKSLIDRQTRRVSTRASSEVLMRAVVVSEEVCFSWIVPIRKSCSAAFLNPCWW